MLHGKIVRDMLYWIHDRHTNSTGVLSITPLKAYLLFYNILSCALWIQIFLLTVAYITTPHPAPASTQSFLSPITKFFSTTTSSSGGKVVDQLRGSYHFMGLGNWVKVTQTLAVLDVVHAALGLVKSNVGTAASQVFSRLWAVWAVVEMVPEVGLLLLCPFVDWCHGEICS
jgi:very-long-chain (3R)-3-hydroxyacyl-CoA dehydratase